MCLEANTGERMHVASMTMRINNNLQCENLFPDAKLPKNIPQNFIRAYLPDDFAEMI